VATSYGYDNIYQLLSATPSSGTAESYTYDPVGNRLSSASVPSYSYNSSNELTSTSSATYGYDLNGNAITKNDSTGITTYAWDFENRLTSVTLPGSGGTVQFRYDPWGRRIYKSSSSGTSIFAYDDNGNLVEETAATGTAVARYSQGLNIDEPLALLRSGTTSYYNADGLGSITSLANAAGALMQTYTFDSFGKQTASTGSLTNPFQYTGRESDPETGLYYYRARYYDPQTGRFLGEDPSGFEAGEDFYVYADNSPISLGDPYGLDSSTWSTLKDLGAFALGMSHRGSHHDDAVTGDLSHSPAMDDIRDKIKKNGCLPGLYCGQYEYKEVPRKRNFNLTIQAVGSFCAYVRVNGGQLEVDAFNEWGLVSGTRNPWGPYRNPSLVDMLFRKGAKWGNPSTLLNNSHSGPLRVQRFWYHWEEPAPCCGQ
jgi:RHS repeat-associated protein